MGDRFKIEPHTGMWESSPAPGNTFYHATVWVDRAGPSGFIFEAKPDATPDELERIARARWAAIQNPTAGLRV